MADVAERLHFHHWELAFVEVFAENGGFDWLLGNPPWLKNTWNEGTLLVDYDPLLEIRGMSASDISKQREYYLEMIFNTVVNICRSSPM